MIAFCYASGLIEFARELPPGGLPIANGAGKKLRPFISAVAEHSRYHADVLLVPGFTRDENGQPLQHENLDALAAWLDWIGGHTTEGVEVFRSAVSRKARPHTRPAR